jgi:hypothetical protein
MVTVKSPKDGTQKLPQTFNIVEIYMTIHWKALEEHYYLIVPEERIS